MQLSLTQHQPNNKIAQHHIPKFDIKPCIRLTSYFQEHISHTDKRNKYCDILILKKKQDNEIYSMSNNSQLHKYFFCLRRRKSY